jgi:hypothetical protein
MGGFAKACTNPNHG